MTVLLGTDLSCRATGSYKDKIIKMNAAMVSCGRDQHKLRARQKKIK